MVDNQTKVMQVPATLEGAALLKDGGLSVRFHTKELPEDEKMTASKFYQKYGNLYFVIDGADAKVDFELPQADEFAKTPSQRLRNTLYVYYQQSGPHDVTFDEFYRQKLEKFINAIKQNLKD